MVNFNKINANLYNNIDPNLLSRSILATDKQLDFHTFLGPVAKITEQETEALYRDPAHLDCLPPYDVYETPVRGVEIYHWGYPDTSYRDANQTYMKIIDYKRTLNSYNYATPDQKNSLGKALQRSHDLLERIAGDITANIKEALLNSSLPSALPNSDFDVIATYLAKKALQEMFDSIN